MTAIIENTDFDIFSGDVEGPHGSVHVTGVGGFMRRYLSPVDPIFWLHHANVDRQWDIWTRRQKRLNCPSSPTNAKWMNYQFLFFTDASGQTLTETAGQYTDIATLNYAYAAGSLATLATAGGTNCMPASPPTPIASAVSSGPNLFRVARETSLGLEIPVRSFVEAQRPAAEPPAIPMERLTARFTVTVPPDTTGVRLKVFINCPYLDATTPPTDPHFVGSYSFFEAAHSHGGGDHGAHGGERTVTFQLPLSSAIARLPRDRPNNSALKFQIITEGQGAGGTGINAGLRKVEVIKS